MRGVAFAALVLATMAGPVQAEPAPAVTVSRSGTQPSVRGSSDWFTGTARIDPLFTARDPARASGSAVTFEPGARTVWHTHAAGQTLVVTAGAGWVQQWGGPVQEIHPGDVVTVPSGVKHWHGATATTGMTHIAIQEAVGGKVVDWQEPVTDAQYRR
jgi:quercetin dioxygenase-like cupin family protein